MNRYGRTEAAGAAPLDRWRWKIQLGKASNGLPLALGRRQFCLDHRDQRAASLVKGLGQFEDRSERGLLMAKFKDAHISSAKVAKGEYTDAWADEKLRKPIRAEISEMG